MNRYQKKKNNEVVIKSNDFEISLRNLRAIKMLPRIVAIQIIEKWSRVRPEEIRDAGALVSQSFLENLPLCQDIGNYLNRWKQGGQQKDQEDASASDLLAGQEKETRLKAVIMIVKIRSFYNTDGNVQAQRHHDEVSELEDLAELADKFLQVVSSIVYNTHASSQSHEQGGEVIEFTGDQIVAAFPGETHDGEDEGASENILKALRAAQKIHYFLGKIIPADSRREVSIGIGYGPCQLVHVGGVFGRTSYFVVGEALQQAHSGILVASISQDHKGVIVSKELWQEVKNAEGTQAGEDSSHNPLANAAQVHQQGQVKLSTAYDELTQLLTSHPFLSSLQKTSKVHPTNSLGYVKRELEGLSKLQRQRVWPDLQRYIPNYFRAYLDQSKQDGREKWKGDIKQGNHHRVLTIMALSLELEGAFESEEAMFVLQTTIEIIQKQIYKLRGSLTRIFYDGCAGPSSDPRQGEESQGGLQIEAEWGLGSLTNFDNPTRACLAAINIQKAVREFILLSNNGSQSLEKLDGLPGTATPDQQDDTTFKIELPIHVGIATGRVFQAIVGDDSTKSQRLEIGYVGEAYNRARSLRVIAQKDFGRIYVDSQTMTEARSSIEVAYVRHVSLTSQHFNLPLYEPSLADPLDSILSSRQPNVKQAFLQFESDFLLQGGLIKIHPNPLVLDRENSYGSLNNKTYGRADQVKVLIKNIVKRTREEQLSLSKSQDATLKTAFAPYTILVKGEKGMGKSLFARSILINLKQLETLITEQIKQLAKPKRDNSEVLNRLSTSIFDPSMSKAQLKFRFCASQCNPEMSLQFLGIWRPVMRILLSQMASVNDKKPKKTMQHLIEKYETLIGNKVLFILDFFGIDDMDRITVSYFTQKTPQVPVVNRSKFFEAQRFDEDFEADILTFLHKLVFEAFDTVAEQQASAKESGSAFAENTALVFILDNVSTMNETDWALFSRLAQETDPRFLNLVIVLNADERQQFLAPLRQANISNFNIAINPASEAYYLRNLKPLEKDLFLEVVQLRPLSRDDIRKMIMDQSKVYSKQTNEEIDRLVQVLPKENRYNDDNPDITKSNISHLLDQSQGAGEIKSSQNPQDRQELLRSQLQWKYQVFAPFTDIDEEVIDYLMEVMKGNPLSTLSFFQSLLTQGFIEIQETKIVLTRKLKQTLKYGNFACHFDLSYYLMSEQLVYLDQRVENIRRTAPEPQIVVACYYTVEVASLIGQKFSSQMLIDSGACPPIFTLSKTFQVSLFEILDILEENDLIELIYEWKGNRFYRFNHESLQNIIQYIMPFKGAKKRHHQTFAEYHQNVSKVNFLSNFSEEEVLRMLIRQLMLKSKALYPSKLDQDALMLIARKETSLRCQQLKEMDDKNRVETLIHEADGLKAKGPVFDAYFQPPVKDKKAKKEKQREVVEYHPIKLKMKGTKMGNKETYSLYFTDLDGKHVLKILITDVGEISLVDASSSVPVETFEIIPKKRKFKLLNNDKKGQEEKKQDEEKIVEDPSKQNDLLLLHLTFNTSESLSILFADAETRITWSTSLRFLKERVQYDHFMGALGQDLKQQVESGREAFTRTEQFSQSLVKAVMVGKAGRYRVPHRAVGPNLDASMHRALNNAGRNQDADDKIYEPIQNKQDDKKERTRLLKEQLKLMYAVGLNHFASHSSRVVQSIAADGSEQVFEQTPPYARQLVQRRADGLRLLIEAEIMEEIANKFKKVNRDRQNSEMSAYNQSKQEHLQEDSQKKNKRGAGLSVSGGIDPRNSITYMRESLDLSSIPGGLRQGSEGELGYGEEYGDELILDQDPNESQPDEQEQQASHESGEPSSQAQSAYDSAPRSNQQEATTQQEFRQSQGPFESATEAGIGSSGTSELQTLILQNLRDPANLISIMTNLEKMQDLGYEERVSLIPTTSLRLFKRKYSKYNPEFAEGVEIFRFNQDEQDDIVQAYQSAQRFTLNGLSEEEQAQVFHAHNKTTQYNLKCQKARRAFTDTEIQALTLKCRRDSPEGRLNILETLGQRDPTSEESMDELDVEMQHILAAAITKILEQNANTELVTNIEEKIIDEIQKDLNESSQKPSLRVEASQKLIETLSNRNDSFLLKRSLSRSLSRKLQGPANESHRLRSGSLLQNYIDRGGQLEADIHGNNDREEQLRRGSLRARAEAYAQREGSPSNRTASDRRSRMQQISQMLGTSESIYSLKRRGPTAQNQNGDSIDRYQSRELLNMHQSQEELKEQRIEEVPQIYRSKTDREGDNVSPQAPSPRPNFQQNLSSMVSQRSILQSQYSVPILEQEAEQEPDEDLNLQKTSESLPQVGQGQIQAQQKQTTEGITDNESLIESLHSLVEQKQQEFFEQTFNRQENDFLMKRDIVGLDESKATGHLRRESSIQRLFEKEPAIEQQNSVASPVDEASPHLQESMASKQSNESGLSKHQIRKRQKQLAREEAKTSENSHQNQTKETIPIIQENRREEFTNQAAKEVDRSSLASANSSMSKFQARKLEKKQKAATQGKE